MAFDFSARVVQSLPVPASPYTGFPEFNFVGGHNDPGSLDVAALTEACRSVLSREGKTLATYCLDSGPQGYLPLRDYLVGKLKNYAEIDCTSEQILLTTGSLQAIDLINTVMLTRGDTIVVEESNYGGVLSRWKALGVNLVAVPVDDDGMQTDQLSKEMQTLASKGITPRFIYTIPTVHNPTGTIMSLARRKELLAIAEEHDVVVFEDECYSDLIWEGERPPALLALDGSGRVIHVGSFSKTIAPALRVGYVVADWSLLKHLLSVKNDAGSGALEQMLLAEYCQQHFDSHLVSLNRNLKAKLDTLTNALDREFGSTASFNIPPGGIFLWVHLPEPVDTSQLAKVAAESGIAINPGIEWSLGSTANRSMRLCFANATPDNIRQGIAKLAQVCFDEFGLPQFSGNRERS